MSRVFRHDAITLHEGVKEEEFERFMREELMPYFAQRFRGPTRVSRADLKSQALLSDAQDRRKWLLVTAWSGHPDSVRGRSFENARMITFEETGEMLKRLKTFGKRGAERVFGEVTSSEVPTNK